MSIETQLTQLNSNLERLIGLLSQAPAVTQVAAPDPAPAAAPAPAPAEKPDYPSVDSLIKAAVAAAKRVGREPVEKALADVAPGVARMTLVPEDKRAQLINTLEALDG